MTLWELPKANISYRGFLPCCVFVLLSVVCGAGFRAAAVCSVLCSLLRLLRCGACGLRFVVSALSAFLVPLVALLGSALFGLRCVVRLRLLVGVAFPFPLCLLSVVRALFGLFVLLSFVAALVLFALFGAGFLQHRPNYNLLLKEKSQ